AEINYGVGKNKRGTVILVTVGTGLGTALFRDGILTPNTELGHILLQGEIAEKYASAAARETLGLSYKQWAKRFDLYLHRLQDLLWPDL
ncbi:MAG: ROK family protein, partial [Gammaproteobacteria bacterium]|nr:ROK family protein [Gammaproteobacteria bacterium]NIR27707.1 ROK family protein [Gammaproteobacteria bacterium]